MKRQLSTQWFMVVRQSSTLDKCIRMVHKNTSVIAERRRVSATMSFVLVLPCCHALRIMMYCSPMILQITFDALTITPVVEFCGRLFAFKNRLQNATNMLLIFIRFHGVSQLN